MGTDCKGQIRTRAKEGWWRCEEILLVVGSLESAMSPSPPWRGADQKERPPNSFPESWDLLSALWGGQNNASNIK